MLGNYISLQYCEFIYLYSIINLQYLYNVINLQFLGNIVNLLY